MMTQVFSADNYFMVDGVYKFDGQQLSRAHNKCLRDFTAACACTVGMGSVTILRGISGSGKSTFIKNHPGLDLVVDNTNISAVEVAPYAAIALAYGLDVEIVNLEIDPLIAAGRNTHGVPEKSVIKMAQRMEAEQQNFPPWWTLVFYVWDDFKHTHVKTGKKKGK